jgi:hypothetical protein
VNKMSTIVRILRLSDLIRWQDNIIAATGAGVMRCKADVLSL